MRRSFAVEFAAERRDLDACVVTFRMRKARHIFDSRLFREVGNCIKHIAARKVPTPGLSKLAFSLVPSACL
jgi:hypothetical protein